MFGSPTETISVTATGDNNIDGLLDPLRWKSTSVSYSFTDNFQNDYESFYPFSERTSTIPYTQGFQMLNPLQRTIARSWMSAYASVSLLKPYEITGASDRDATIRMATSNSYGTANAYGPWNSVEAGDAFFNSYAKNTTPVIGNYAYSTFGHEIGHAFGLKHGHLTGGIRDVAMNADRDSKEFSIMTYHSYIGAPTGALNEDWGFSQSLMMYDIRAIQQMYGANFTTNATNTTYTFSTATGEMFVNGVGQGTPGANRIFRTIWDGNGIDTYDFSNYTTKLSIDLTPGGWSDLNVGGNFQRANLDIYSGTAHYARGHVFNALQYNNDPRSLIENANGGSGNDRIVGNSANNVLNGNGGDDTIYAITGDDSLNGGAGNDILFAGQGNDILDGGIGNDILSGAQGNDTYIIDADVNFGIDTISETTTGGIDTLQFGSTTTKALYVNLNNNAITTLTGGQLIIPVGTIENVEGGMLNDILVGNNLNNYLNGSSGSDNLSGGNGNDILYGELGDDTLDGGSGNDTLDGDVGNDTLVGGLGNDLLIGHFGNDTYAIDADVDIGTDTITDIAPEDWYPGINGGIDTIDFSTTTTKALLVDLSQKTVQTVATGVQLVIPKIEIENLIGGTGNDYLIGNGLNNNLSGGNGNDELDGGAGNDILNGGDGDDWLFGEAGNDKLYGGAGNDTLLVFGIGNDLLDGGEGNDIYYIDNSDLGVHTIVESVTSGSADAIDFRNTTSAAITIDISKTTTQTIATGVQLVIPVVSIENVYGGNGNNTIIGNYLDNYLLGKAGNDTLNGGAGNDILLGGAGNDILDGGAGNDYLNAGVGTNTFVGGAGGDAYDINADVDFGLQTIIETGASGGDRLNLEHTTSASVTIDLSKTTTQTVATGVQILISDVSIEDVSGGDGNDTIIGNYLDNGMYGNAGNDILQGGAGNDGLRGGLGADIFQFNYPNEGIDIIFDLTAGDKIGIFAAGFGGGLVAGTALDPSQLLVTTSGISTNSNQRFIYYSETGGLFYDVDGNGASAAVQVGILSGLPNLTASDFVII